MALQDDADMDAQLALTLIGAYAGGADLGESIATAQRVPEGDYDRWHVEWARPSERARDAADRAADQGLSTLAGQRYLRAAEYRRQSYFFLRHDLTDERVQTGYRSQRDLFRQSMPHFSFHVEPIEVPFDPVPLNGYLFRPAGDDDTPRPTVLFPGGFDGTCEEMAKYGAFSAVSMGWNAVTWDGPGQGGQLVEHGMAMRPDFEAVLTPVVDWVVDRPFVSADAIALVGRSLGGYFAPGGASAEPRLRALVCDPSQFDFTSRFIDMFSAEDWQRVLDADPAMESQLEGFLAGARNQGFYGARMAAMGATTFGGWLRTLGQYTLAGRAERIACPTLVTEGEGDFASQSPKLFEALTCPKRLHSFAAADGAGGHCEGMGQLLWQDTWLSEVFTSPE
jgi:hypothetical protein